MCFQIIVAVSSTIRLYKLMSANNIINNNRA